MINDRTRTAKDNHYVVQKLQEDENLWEKYQLKIREIQAHRQIAINKQVAAKNR